MLDELPLSRPSYSLPNVFHHQSDEEESFSVARIVNNKCTDCARARLSVACKHRQVAGYRPPERRERVAHVPAEAPQAGGGESMIPRYVLSMEDIRQAGGHVEAEGEGCVPPAWSTTMVDSPRACACGETTVARDNVRTITIVGVHVITEASCRDHKCPGCPRMYSFCGKEYGLWHGNEGTHPHLSIGHVRMVLSRVRDHGTPVNELHGDVVRGWAGYGDSEAVRRALDRVKYPAYLSAFWGVFGALQVDLIFYMCPLCGPNPRILVLDGVAHAPRKVYMPKDATVRPQGPRRSTTLVERAYKYNREIRVHARAITGLDGKVCVCILDLQ